MGTSMPFRKLDLQFVDTDIANIIDPLLVFNYSASGNNTSDSGVIIERGDLTNVGFIWDESTDTFALINTTEDGSTTGNVSISSYANLRADTITASLTGDVTGDLTGDVTGNVTGNITSSGTSTFTTIDVNGGAIDGTAIGASSASTGAFTTLSSSGNLTVGGNLTVSGTTKTVNSTVVEVADPIMTVGGTSSPSSDDNKDRGIAFRWHDGSSAKLGFFGFDDSTGKFTFIPDSTLSSEVASGTKGTLDVGQVDAETVKIGTSNALSTGTLGFVGNSNVNILTHQGNMVGSTQKFGILGSSAEDVALTWQSAYGYRTGTLFGGDTTNAPLWFQFNDSSMATSTLHLQSKVQLAQGLIFEGSTADSYETTLTVTDPTADNTITLPNASGTVLLADSDEFNLISTDASSSAGPIINLKRDSASPSNADYLGQIKWKGENSTGGEVNYAKTVSYTHLTLPTM